MLTKQANETPEAFTARQNAAKPLIQNAKETDAAFAAREALVQGVTETPAAFAHRQSCSPPA